MCNVSWLQIIAPDWIHGYQQLTEYQPVIQNGYLDQRQNSATATERWHLPEYKRYTGYFCGFNFFFPKVYFLTQDHHAEGVSVRVRECVYPFLVSYSSKFRLFFTKVYATVRLSFLCFHFVQSLKTRKTREFTQLERYKLYLIYGPEI
jgi:hypothetical protein